QNGFQIERRLLGGTRARIGRTNAGCRRGSGRHRDRTTGAAAGKRSTRREQADTVKDARSRHMTPPNGDGRIAIFGVAHPAGLCRFSGDSVNSAGRYNPGAMDSLRFGDYELDLRAYALRRSGVPVKLEKLPMEVLILLAQRA